VIDDKGNLLAHPAEDGAAGATGQSAEDMRLSYENRLARAIETLLERSVGPGKVRAEVTADMDFDRVSTKAEIYDPDGQVVRSTQTVEESSDSNDKQAQEPVTVQTNLPNNPQPAANPASSASKSSRTEETVNYEITKTVKNQIRETGTVKRLSVAVLVDGTYTTAPDGTKTYAPRTEAEMQQLEKLVRSAIGYNADRGDVVDLVNMPFAPVDEGLAENVPEPLFGLTLNDYLRIAELLVLAIVAILVLLMVVRPLVARLIEAIPKPSPSPAMLSDQTGAAGQLPGPGPAPNIPSGVAAQQREELEQMIDINQVEGRVKASSLKKIGEIIDKHPEETVSIIRTWMFQET
jgi:flagellar M-ring protein FliF